MKAYKVHIKYAELYAPVEEIEVHRLTEKSYLDNRGTWRRHTEYHSVYATKAEAIEHAKRMTKASIDRLGDDLKKLQARLQFIEAMEGE